MFLWKIKKHKKCFYHLWLNAGLVHDRFAVRPSATHSYWKRVIVKTERQAIRYLKSRNALNINFFFLPIKLLPLLNLLSCTAWSLFSPSCYSLLICCRPFSTTYILFSKNHQSLIPLCITSSLESTSCLIPPALHKTPRWWCHTL